ncbi:hypothetical protein DYQ86_18125 [Acidobacteria bacterium AB60]|nr:hypothetical protein DYQ86_18125 [Acidobacteria bacterium AB60]
MKARPLLLLLLLLVTVPASAHVGSPDVYADAQAGPYHLSIVIRPPLVIPGVADIEVRSQSADVQRITVTPVPLTGEGSKHPPVPDAMQQPSNDRSYYTGHLWIMTTGSWQVRFAVSGSHGEHTVSIPLPAAAMATRKMQSSLGTFLAVLGFLLVIGMIGIVGAAAREAKLPPGAAPPSVNRRAARIAMTVATVVLVAGVLLGNVWWNSEAASYSEYIYKPLQMNASLLASNTLHLELHDPGWFSQRRLDDFIPDHDHLMHLYVIRWPQMDTVFHLHPQAADNGQFNLALPDMPAGAYRLYADIVHKNGFPETIVGSITVPAIHGTPLSGDDAAGEGTPVSAAQTSGVNPVFRLPDGYTMVWKSPGKLIAKAPQTFQFDLLDKSARPAADEALYMGMLGHAAFVKTDGSVFAHIHPNGSMAMAALMMANPQSPMQHATQADNMPGMDMPADKLPASVSFPYGFPSAGRYRIFVQMKHGGTVETGIFDAEVAPAAN